MAMTKDEQDQLLKETAEAMKKGTPEQRKDIQKALQRAGQKWITNEQFNDQFEIGVEQAKDRGEDELSMTFLLFGARKEPADNTDTVLLPVIFGNWETDLTGDEKDKVMMGLGISFTEEYPDYMLTNVVHISEAWSVQRDQDSPKEDEHIMPSKSPNRIEVAIVSAMSIDHRKSWFQAKILRDKDGKFNGLETLQDVRYDSEDPTGVTIEPYLTMAIYKGYALSASAPKSEKEDNPDDTPTQ